MITELNKRPGPEWTAKAIEKRKYKGNILMLA
jgi:hypothetical protein